MNTCRTGIFPFLSFFLIAFSAVHAGDISGIVTDAGGVPVAGAQVTVFGYSACDNSYIVTEAETDGSGGYLIPDMAAGRYKVFVEPPTGSVLLYQYYKDSQNERSAKTIYVEDDISAGDINVTLTPCGSITGIVADDSGTPLAGMHVTAYDSYSQCMGHAYTDETGAYTMGGLYTGSYQVWVEHDNSAFIMPITREYYQNALTRESATPVDVVEGGTTGGIDFSLYRGACISGVVTDEAGTPIPWALLYAYDYSSGNRVASTQTDSAGGYAFIGLLTGTYAIEVSGEGADFVGEYYTDTQDIIASTPVTALEGDTVLGIDFTLSLMGTLTGTVTNADTGLPVTQAVVLVLDTSGNQMEMVFTDSQGVYAVTGLPAGRYLVKVEPPEDSGLLWAYHGGTRDILNALPVDVSVAGVVNGIDLALVRGGEITGSVTEEGSGAPLEGYPVVACDANGVTVARAFSDAAGVYTISGLAAGTYLAFAGDTAYIGEYYPGTRNRSIAMPITVTGGGGTVSGIGFSLTRYSGISGTVRTGSGMAASADIWIYEQGTDSIVATAANDPETGAYTVNGLLPGTYRVVARPLDSELVETVYVNAPDLAGATPVMVGEQAITSGIDFALGLHGMITGAVTSELSLPIKGIKVEARDPASNACIGSSITDGAGAYAIRALPAGTYRVGTASDVLLTGFINEDYPTTVQVTDGAQSSGVNFSLTELRKITGLVIDEAGSPIPWAYVYAIDPATGDEITSTHTRADGWYTVVGLVAGTYVLRVNSPVEYEFSDFITEFSGGARDVDSSTSVTVSQSGAAPVVSFSLNRYGRIAGTVLSRAGTPLRGMKVCAVESVSHTISASVSTDSTGAYALKGLEAGEYLVMVEDSPDYIGGYYPHTLDIGSASTVRVVEETTTTGIDFSLSLSGKITGTVRDRAGQPVHLVPVYAYESLTKGFRSVAYTNTQGAYTIKGLRSGSYLVSADPSSGRIYARQYYNGAQLQASATPVAVDAEGTSAGIDFTLMKFGRITGVVRDDARSVIANAHVYAYDPADSTVHYDVQTNDLGVFTFTGLYPGRYVVRAEAPTLYCLLDAYYVDAHDQALATMVSVAEDETTQGIDFSLHVMDTDGDGHPDRDDTAIDNPLVWGRPDTPSVTEPADTSTGVALAPILRSSVFQDADGGTHRLSQWQLTDNRGELVMRVMTYTFLTSLQVPDLILEPNMRYYASVSYMDSHGKDSSWSVPVSFVTIAADPADANGNGIPDSQEITAATDIDGNGVEDSGQAGLKCVSTASGGLQIGMEISENCTGLLSLKSVDPSAILDTDNRPGQLPYGLLDFKITVAEPGDTATVVVHLPSPAPAGMVWYTYDTLKGWKTYTNAMFSSDRTSVTLYLKDGDTEQGDIDGVANGVIVDPSGIGTAPANAPTDGSDPGVDESKVVSGNSGGDVGSTRCFMSSASGSAGALPAFLIMVMLCAWFAPQCLRKK